MKPETKRTIKTFFLSFIKNDAAIEGGKTAPWWIAVVLFVIANFLPVIPIMVNTSKTYGASFISGNIFGFEQSIASCEKDLVDNDFQLRIKDHKLLAYNSTADLEANKPLTNTWENDGDFSKDFHPIATYVREYEGYQEIGLNVFYSDRTYSKGANTIVSLISSLDNYVYAGKTADPYNAEVHTEIPYTYVPSYLILYKDGLYGKIYKSNTEKNNKKVATTTYTGLDWKRFDDVDLLSLTMNVDGFETITKETLRDPNYVNGVLNNWKEVLNKSYLNQKILSFWATSGIYYGIFLGITIFMGLILWLLTRGKNNPNRNLNIWITCKIQSWITLTPAILGMVLGFVWSAAAGIGFIVLIGLRTMWMAMRQLSPLAQRQ